MSEDVVDKPRSLKLLIILLIGLACTDACLNVMLTVNFLKSPKYYAGLMIGQLALAGVLAGGTGRAWVVSLLLTSLLAISFNLLLLSLTNWPDWVDADEFIDPCILLVGCTPPLLFCCSLPFLLTRAITGYRLSQPPAAVGRAINMEDFFLTTGVFAAMLVLIPAALKTDDSLGDNSLAEAAIGGLVFCAVSLLVVLPSTITYFVLKRPVLRLLALAGVCFGVPLLAMWVLLLSGLLRLSGTRFMEEFGTPLVTATGCFALCLVVLRSVGFAWLRDSKAVEPTSVNPLGDEALPAIPKIARWQNRVAAVVMIIASAGFVIFCKNLERQRRELDGRLAALEFDWSTHGGEIVRDKYAIHVIHAPLNARLEDLGFLLRSNELGSIKISGTGVTDAMLSQTGRLTDLETIDLGHTHIGDDGLRKLMSAKNVNSINLAYTKVTTAGLQEFLADKEHAHTLNLSGLGLTDSDIAKLPLTSISHLRLSHNPLTAAALPYLQHASMLDLSHTQIAGADLTQLEATYLTLDYTPTNDEQIKARCESSRKLDGLSLRGTQVTDASLLLFTNVTHLAIGDCPITSAGLAQSDIAQSGLDATNTSRGMSPNGLANKLALNDKHFDGSLFATRPWYVAHLDLRNSSISDRDIYQLANVKGLSVLDLRNCDISDASLPFLSMLPITAIDVTDTKVTGEGASRFLSGFAVYISAAQCSLQVLIRHHDLWHVGGMLNEPLSSQ